jgi:VanZ family protein
VLYMAMIFALSSLSDPPDVPSVVGDKVGHAALYFGLGALFARAFAGGWLRRLTARAAIATVLCSTLYGVSDEMHQMLVPPRTVEIGDVLADALGSSVAAALIYAAARVRSRRA